jgi:hypothetical protein
MPKNILNSLANLYKVKNIKDSATIINTLSNKNDVCRLKPNSKEKELCILEQIKKDNNHSGSNSNPELVNKNISTIINKYIITYFKPVTKQLHKNYWINNTEIDNIQYQFQKKFKGYYYSYIHMIDLEMYKPQNNELLLNHEKILNIKDINFKNELNKLNNYLKYNGDLKYYGIVCNTDTSQGSGIHWFSIFIDFTNNPITIEYFNSSGYDIKNDDYGNNFKNFFINLADDLTFNKKNCKFIKVTNIEHQRSDTANCGSYSLYYIWKRLNNTSYEYFKDNQIIDEDMEKFRSFLWRK